MATRRGLILAMLMGAMPAMNGCQNLGGGQAAAVGAGAFLGFGAVTQAATYSDLKVEVDVFREPDPSPNKNLNLGHPPAAAQFIREAQAESVDEIIRKLAEPFAQIQGRIGLLQPTRSVLAKLESGERPAPEWVQLSNDLERMNSAWSRSTRAYQELIRMQGENLNDGTLSAIELRMVEGQLRVLAASLQGLSVEPPSGLFAKAIENRMATRLQNLDIHSKPRTNFCHLLSEVLTRNRSYLDSAGTTEEQVARLLFLVSQFYKAQPGLSDTGPIGETLKEFGFYPITGGQVIGASSYGEMLSLVKASYSLPIIENKSREAIELIYSAALKGFNLGPLTNEAMQQVLAQSRMIDIITDPQYGDKCFGLRKSANWVRLNGAESRSHLGNHNAVVYLENIATPVLKSSEFNPTDFIVANGALYRRAFDAMVNAYGMPLPPQPGQTSTDISSLNLFNIQARATRAREEREKNRNGLLGLIKATIEEQKLTKAAQKTPDDATQWADATKKQAAVKSAAERLRTAASTLDSLVAQK